MSLTTALFTGLSGLDVNQARLNVVGNNIANVNSVAFKSSRALFKPQFYITDSSGSPPSGTFGGSNPSQRGLGASVAAIDKDFSSGSIEPTGRATDMAISGNGFFVVQGQAQRFTRDGSFKLNGANTLVTTGGDFVQGYAVDENFNIISGRLANLRVPIGELTLAEATENASFQGNLNAGGQVAAGSSVINSENLTTMGGGAAPTGTTLLTAVFRASPLTAAFASGDVLTLQGKRNGASLDSRTFTVTPASTLNDLMQFYNQGLGIDTSVAPPTGVAAPGTTIKSTGATTVQLVIAGNTGRANLLSLDGATTFTNQTGQPIFAFDDSGTTAGGIVGIDASSAISATLAGESQSTTITAYDSLGNPIDINVTMVLEQKLSAGGTQWRYFATSGDDTDVNTLLGSGLVTFDASGQLLSGGSVTSTIDRLGTGAGTPQALAINFGRLTAVTDTRGSTIRPYAQDGSPIGTLADFSLAETGEIIGTFSNGLQRVLGQVAVATFRNPQGLVDQGGNMYGVGANSGEPGIGTPLLGDAGGVQSGALELSNVDLSKEFTNLIIASTGFSAASKVISTSDQLIQELLNATR